MEPASTLHLHINLELLAHVYRCVPTPGRPLHGYPQKQCSQCISQAVPSPAVGGPVAGSTEPYESITEYLVVDSKATRLGNWKTQQSLHQQKMNEKV